MTRCDYIISNEHMYIEYTGATQNMYTANTKNMLCVCIRVFLYTSTQLVVYQFC